MPPTSQDSFHNISNATDLLDLGSFRDPSSLVPYKVTIKKEDLSSDSLYKLKVQSQNTTGSLWLCVGIFKSENYPVKQGTNHNDAFKDVLTKEFKLGAANNGCANHGLRVSKFVSVSDQSNEERQGMTGRPEHSFTSLTVTPEVEVGSYVIVLGYGRPFGNDPFLCYKEVVVDVQ